MSFKELERLADLSQGQVVCEVGAHLGLSTIAIASTASKVVSIDWHRGDTQTKGWGFTLGPYVNNLVRYGVLDTVSVVCADANDVGPLLADASFDFIFIDADHRYEAVRRNIELFVPKAKPGGLIAFHDYGVDECFEKQAVDEVFDTVELTETLAVVRV